MGTSLGVHAFITLDLRPSCLDVLEDLSLSLLELSLDITRARGRG